MVYTLPTTLSVGGRDIPIRTEYTAAIDIINALASLDFTPEEKAEIVLRILYKEPIKRRYQEEALRQAYWYLDGGQEPRQGHKSPTLIDWEKDWQIIVAPVNRVLGHDIRADGTLHWWSFLSAYMEIGGDCLLSQVVGIRDKRARGEKLEDYERKWAARNEDLLNLPTRYSQEDLASFAEDGII